MTAVPLTTPRTGHQRFLDHVLRLVHDGDMRQYVYITEVRTGHQPADPDPGVAAIRAISPHSRIAHIQHDPTVIGPEGLYCSGLADTSPPPIPALGRCGTLRTDLRRTHEVLLHLGESMGIDQTAPIAVIADLVLACVSDRDDPGTITDLFHGWAADGSVLVITHESTPDDARWTRDDARSLHAAQDRGHHIRTTAGLTELFGDWQLRPPGVVEAARWGPHGLELPAYRPAGIPVRVGVATRT